MKEISFLCLIIITLFSCVSDNKEAPDENIVSEKSYVIEIDTFRTLNKDLNYRIDYFYPQIQGDIYQKINDRFIEIKENHISSFLTFIKDFDAFSQRTCTAKSVVQFKNKYLLSIVMPSVLAVPGTSRLITETETINWSFERNKKIQLNDILISGWKNKIKKLAKSQLIDSCNFDDVKMSFEKFSFSKENIIIYDTHIVGGPECYENILKFSWKEIDELLNEKGKELIKKMM